RGQRGRRNSGGGIVGGHGFARAPQGGRWAARSRSWRRSRGRRSSLRQARRRDRDFRVGADDLFAIHLHDLHALYLIAVDADKFHLLGRRAVDPLFVVALRIALANFLRRLALGIDHHVTIHAHQHFVLLHGVPHFGRHGVYVGLGGRKRGEIEHRRQQLLDFVGRHFGNKAVELQSQIGTMRIRGAAVPTDGRHAAHAADFDVLIPLLLLFGA